MKEGTRKGQKKCGRKKYVFFCSSGKVKTEKHFILDNRESYGDILATSSWDNLFSKEFVEKLKM